MENRFYFRIWYFEEEEWTFTTAYIWEMTSNMSEKLIYTPRNKKNIDEATGKKDKNGELIFENDIVYKKGAKKWTGEKLLSKVIWDEQDARFMISDDNGIHNIPRNSANIEIVGNIYENADSTGEQYE